MWETFLQAFGLMLVFEGILPFVSPEGWRSLFIKLACAPDREVRWVGLMSMAVGVCLLLYLSN